MLKEVHVIFSDGDREIYTEGYTKVSEEFLEQNNVNNHVIVTQNYLKWIEQKAKSFDEILDINIDKDELLSEEYIEKVNDVIQEWIFS